MKALGSVLWEILTVWLGPYLFLALLGWGVISDEPIVHHSAFALCLFLPSFFFLRFAITGRSQNAGRLTKLSNLLGTLGSGISGLVMLAIYLAALFAKVH